MNHFQKSHIPAVNRGLSRSLKSVEIKKTCAQCGKGFCKRKGRAKAAMVGNMPGRHICEHCLNERQQQGGPVYKL